VLLESRLAEGLQRALSDYLRFLQKGTGVIAHTEVIKLPPKLDGSHPEFNRGIQVFELQNDVVILFCQSMRKTTNVYYYREAQDALIDLHDAVYQWNRLSSQRYSVDDPVWGLRVIQAYYELVPQPLKVPCVT
jgi:hypothetical protein